MINEFNSSNLNVKTTSKVNEKKDLVELDEAVLFLDTIKKIQTETDSPHVSKSGLLSSHSFSNNISTKIAVTPYSNKDDFSEQRIPPFQLRREKSPVEIIVIEDEIPSEYNQELVQEGVNHNGKRSFETFNVNKESIFPDEEKFSQVNTIDEFSSNTIKHGKDELVIDNKVFSGFWKNGVLNEGKVVVYEKRENKRVHLYTYEGQLNNFTFHGKGEIKYPNGFRFQGSFKNNQFDGIGEWTNPANESCRVVYAKNKKQGFPIAWFKGKDPLKKLSFHIPANFLDPKGQKEVPY